MIRRQLLIIGTVAALTACAASEPDEAYAEVSGSSVDFCLVPGRPVPDDAVLEVDVSGCGVNRRFASGRIKAGADGMFRFRSEWKDVRRWDVHTPSNRYTCTMRLKGADGRELAAPAPFVFGIRKVGISGRNLLLNGIPVHLRAQNVKIARIPALWDRPVAVKILKRMREVGFNTAVMDNYGIPEGLVLKPQGLFEAADELGFLVVCSLPHAKEFDLQGMEDAEVRARYRAAARRMIREARNHPSVILYSANHNACGYAGNQNPDRMDGTYEPVGPREDSVRARVRRSALQTEEIVRSIDPTRPVYHHESGNLGAWHTCNIYLDWAPRQERSDWLEGWSRTGRKPLFFVEWGFPHVANWSSLRGPLHIWGGLAFQSLWAAEYSAAVRGECAYEDTPLAREALRREEDLWRTGKPFRFNQICDLLRKWESNYVDVTAWYAADNWRAMRAWGLTAIVPWDRETLHRRKGGEVTSVPQCFEDASDAEYELTSLGREFVRWNRDDCAFLGGTPVFTDKRRNYRPGETAAKTLVVLSDRRTPQTVEWSARLKNASGEVVGRRKGQVTVRPAGRTDVPLDFTLPESRGTCTLEAAVRFASGEIQRDALALCVLGSSACAGDGKTLLFDDRGLTAGELDRLGIRYRRTDLRERPDRGATLIVGRESLTRAIYEERVVPLAERQGRILVFEQSKETLESLGFRVQELGLRRTFPRFASASLGALDENMLSDWAGESTLLPPRSRIDPGAEVCPPHAVWAGFRNTRVWRCGNRGTVASVLPEKPANGDWRALCDGAFALESAPLLERRIADGRITFCQLDVTARSVADPAADEVLKRLVMSLGTREGGTTGQVQPIGAKAMRLADRMGLFSTGDFYGTGKGLWLVASGAQCPKGWADRIAAGGKALLVGLTAEEVRTWSPEPVDVSDETEVYPSRIADPPPELDGLSAADLFWHGTLDFAAFAGADQKGNAAVKVIRHGRGTCVFLQLSPEVIGAETRPWHRVSLRAFNRTLTRVAANLGFGFVGGTARYLDLPEAEDDPYRYFHW